MFSIMFRKEFYTILNAENNNNTRQINLLETVGVEDRIVYEGSFVKRNKIDYIDCHNRMNLLIKKSEDYLINAIEN